VPFEAKYVRVLLEGCHIPIYAVRFVIVHEYRVVYEEERVHVLFGS
jgi:hypothetical protein